MSASTVLEQMKPPDLEEAPARRGGRLPFSPWHLILFPVAIVMVLPLLWMLITSVETLNETRIFPPVLIPHGIHLENYTQVLRLGSFDRWFANTTIVTTVCVVANLLFCSMAGYAFARMRFFGSGVVFILVLATLMIPFQVVMIPTFLIVKKLGLIDSLGALIVPNLANAFGIFMLRQFFRTLPIELEEAARIDGASRLGVLFKIVLPLSLPGPRDARRHPVHVDVERLPVAAHHDLLATEHDAPTRADHVPGGAPDQHEPADGGQRDEHGADPDPVLRGAALFHPRHRHIGTEGMRG